MNNEKTSIKFKIFVFSLTVAFILFAFIHSSMPSDMSDEESISFMFSLQDILNALGINAELSNHIVRKVAHFTEYTAIGIMLMADAYSFNRLKPYKYYLQILFFGLLVPVLDETIQLNVEGRSGQITDVLLDFSGVITGTLLMLAFLTIYVRIKKINKLP
ncbi:MAG: VanZ family protein [Ruminococcus sp.]|nr:VanZ family protein [Ruminococcus sp.]